MTEAGNVHPEVSELADRGGQLIPLSRFDWERLVLRTKLGHTTKLVALAMATYASADGTKVHPGVDRLAAELGCNERTVRRALEALRAAGLLLRVRSGSSSGRRKLADVYRLTRPSDTSQRVALLSLTATEHRALESGVRPLGAPDHRALESGDSPDHRALESGDLAPITGRWGPDHRALESDHRALASGSPGTSAHLPSMTNQSDQTNRPGGSSPEVTHDRERPARDADPSR